MRDLAKAALAAAQVGDTEAADDLLSDIGLELIALHNDRQDAALAYANKTADAAVVREADDALKRARSVYTAAQGAVLRAKEKRASEHATEREAANRKAAERSEPSNAEKIAAALAELGLS